jgi:hypothetical protein
MADRARRLHRVYPPNGVVAYAPAQLRTGRKGDELRVHLADAHATIEDLRRRLDAADAERRAAQERLTALLTDQRPMPAPDSPRSPWRRFLAWRSG